MWTVDGNHGHGFFWQPLMGAGVLLVLMGLAVLLFPAILVALVAAAILTTGGSMIAAGWRLRKLERLGRGVTRVNVVEW